MKATIRFTAKLVVPALIVLSAMTARGQQDARLRFDDLNLLGDKASEVVEVNIDGKLLDLAKRVLVKVNDQDAKKIGQAISGLKGIYVRVFNFENDNEYNMADVDAIRAQLQAPGWEKLANVRSRKNEQKIDVYTMFQGDMISGAAVVISEKRSVALVNVVGPIDIDLLVELSGKLNIPKIDVEKETETKENNQ